MENCAVSVFFWKKMKNLRYSLFRLLLAVTFACSLSVFSGCMQPLGDEGEENGIVEPLAADSLLCGKWQDNYTDWNTYGSGDNSYDYQIGVSIIEDGSYTGTNSSTLVYYRQVNSDSGYIYYKFTFNYSAYENNGSGWTTVEVPSINKWGAIYYKNLTTNSVNLSSFSGSKKYVDTLDEAVKEFTVAKGYFASVPPCTRVVSAPVQTAGNNFRSVSLNNTSWFTGSSKIDFPEIEEALYLNYFADGLNSNRWIRLTSKGNTSYEAEIVWSKDIREIGKKSDVQIGLDSANKLFIQSDFLNLTGLESYEGVTASAFDPSKVPALTTDYLSNFSGNYTLNSTQYTLNIGAKLNINKNVSHYWNANILNTTYNESTKTYDMLLAHTSQNDAAGSIDPGITGSEPFISQQGLFWSHLTLSAKPGSQWEIKWSSVWKNSPYEALNSSLDMQDTFTGPATTKIHYSYKFYFGNPKLSGSWYTVEKGDSIYSVEFESDLPIDKTWKQIYDDYEIASKVNVPEDKLADYWWYSTNSSTGIEDSYVYKLSDTSKPPLAEHEFYLALKDKPAPVAIYTRPGKYYNASKGYLEITENTIQWNEDVYTIVDGARWSLWNKNESAPNRVAYLIKKDNKNYLCSVWYFINKPNSTNKYVNFELPLESSLSKCPETYDYQSDDCKTGSTQKNLDEQDSSFVYPIPVQYPLYYNRSSFWQSNDGFDYNGSGQTSDNSGYCFFILKDENTIIWVTYPLVEDEEEGEEYRERHEYTLKKDSNGLWQLQENVSNADSEDFSGTSNLSMMEYIDGLGLIFSDNTISVDYKGYLKIKEWYTKVNSEPQTKKYIYIY